MKMQSNLIVCSEVIVLNSEVKSAWDMWCKSGGDDLPKGSERRCYQLEEKSNHFLELISIDKFSDLESMLVNRESFVSGMASKMESDWRQQVIKHVETVKPIKGKLPDSPKLQLRYIEVPLSVKQPYLNWRENTIFDVVRQAEPIDSFLAYHTLFSTQPGVMFLSGFSGDSASYMSEVFLTPRYKQIGKEAGEQFVVGGEGGLSTRIYIAK
jgi:hypothetical protein